MVKLLDNFYYIVNKMKLTEDDIFNILLTYVGKPGFFENPKLLSFTERRFITLCKHYGKYRHIKYGECSELWNSCIRVARNLYQKGLRTPAGAIEWLLETAFPPSKHAICAMNLSMFFLWRRDNMLGLLI